MGLRGAINNTTVTSNDHRRENIDCKELQRITLMPPAQRASLPWGFISRSTLPVHGREKRALLQSERLLVHEIHAKLVQDRVDSISPLLVPLNVGIDIVRLFGANSGSCRLGSRTCLLRRVRPAFCNPSLAQPIVAKVPLAHPSGLESRPGTAYSDQRMWYAPAS